LLAKYSKFASVADKQDAALTIQNVRQAL